MPWRLAFWSSWVSSIARDILQSPSRTSSPFGSSATCLLCFHLGSCPPDTGSPPHTHTPPQEVPRMCHSKSAFRDLWLPHIQRFVCILYSHKFHRTIYSTLDLGREEMTETKTLDPEGSVEFILSNPLSSQRQQGACSELLRLNQGLDPEPLNCQSTGLSN